MLFNSIIFFLFAAIFFLFLPLVNRRKNILFFYIIIFSFVFYGWWDWRYLFLLIGSGCIDFVAGQAMVRYPRHKTAFLILSMIGNIGSLAMFKYSGFFASNLDGLFNSFGVNLSLEASLPAFLAVLPVGISFYTFQSMSYTFDIYRGQLKPTNNIFHFFAYLAMFPQLVAGPIVRARQLLGQLDEPLNQSEAQRWKGTKLIVTGYFMKVVLADNLASFVNTAFVDQSPSESLLYWWLIMIGFAFQIYYDFAGYSRIARGLAYWMGYEFPQNFDHPYGAKSLQDFWRRWHITLSTWFRDYLYFPLGGSRVGRLREHINLWIVMLVSGLWHGAAWNFVIWGAVHAGFYSFERETQWSKRLQRFAAPGLIASILITNIVVIIAWVFFRSPTLNQSFYILGTMFSGDLTLELDSDLFFWLGNGLLFELLLVRYPAVLDTAQPTVRRLSHIIVIGCLIMLTIFFRGPGSEFIYFQF